MCFRYFFLLWPFLLVSAVPVGGGEWPQILGPDRNGRAHGETLRPWAEGEPRMLWSYTLGEGYAGCAVKDGRVVVFHRQGDIERVEAMDSRTGRVFWKRDFPASYRGGVNPDRGPRCVPLVYDQAVYLLGAAGDLHCVSLQDGRKIWSRPVYEQYSALEGYFGAGSTPIVVDDKLLVNVGGRDDAGLVAFSLADGQTLWKGTQERASYASPVTANVGGKKLRFS